MNRKKIEKAIIALILLALGVVWFGNAIRIWNVDVFFPGWWAVLLMVCFLISIISDGPNIGNVFFLLFFGVVVLQYTGLISERINLWLVALAFAVVVFGGKLLISAFRGDRQIKPSDKATFSGSDSHERTADGTGNVSYTFTGETLRFAGQTVYSSSYSVSFGSLTLDFSGAVFAENTVISVSANFGEVKIRMPAGTKAVSENHVSFASVKNDSEGNAEVHFLLDSSFGSISIINA